jgi:hypothetical protein
MTQMELDNINPEHTHESGIFSDVTTDTLKDPDYMRLISLFHRLFEAHFLPVQMTILVIASTLFVFVTEHTPDHDHLRLILRICEILRTGGFMLIAAYLCLYERFHKLAAGNREREMREAGLARGMHFSKRSIKNNYIDYVMVPLVAPLYGAIPCVHAQFKHFYTLDLVYTVSKKVTRLRTKSMSLIADTKV